METQTLLDWLDAAISDSASSLIDLEAACELADDSDLELDIERHNENGYLSALVDFRHYVTNQEERAN
jgi:hypothetical protein|tara:strand:- start:1263 stop:1466 length:204 start_codon:yes stop_codon:yes gene_type:complete